MPSCWSCSICCLSMNMLYGSQSSCIVSLSLTCFFESIWIVIDFMANLTPSVTDRDSGSSITWPIVVNSASSLFHINEIGNTRFYGPMWAIQRNLEIVSVHAFWMSNLIKSSMIQIYSSVMFTASSSRRIWTQDAIEVAWRRFLNPYVKRKPL